MKNLLVLLTENPDSTLCNNSLSADLSSETANKISNYLFEMALSETYPVNFQYELSIGIYNKKDLDFLEDNMSSYCKTFSSSKKTIGEFVLDIAKSSKEYKNIIFLKSNSIGLIEEDIINHFNKLDENNIVFGESGEKSFYLFGFNIDILEDLNSLKDINEEAIEKISDDFHLLLHQLPENKAVEDIDSLIKLRESLSDKTSLASTIDRLALGIDRTRHKEEK